MRRIQVHKSSLLAGLLVAVVLALISVPGIHRDQQYLGAYAPSDALGVFDHGWPVIYMSRKVKDFTYWYHGVGARTAPWLSWECWDLNDGAITQTSLTNLGIDLGACLAIVVTAIALWEYRRRLRASAWQITLREMFVATFVVASIFGWLAYEARVSSDELRHVDSVYNLDKELGDWAPNIIASNRPDLPVWLIRLVGAASIPESLWRFRELQVSPSFAGDYSTFDVALPHLLHLSRANSLSIDASTEGPEVPFDDIARLLQLRTLELYSLDYDEEKAWQIRADDLRKLRHLDLIILPSRSSLSAECAAILEKEMPACRVEFGDEE